MTRRTVRTATPDDLPAIRALRRAWVEEVEGPVDDPTYDGRFDAWWAEQSPHRLTWLGLIDGEVVGMVNVLEFRRMPRPRSGEPTSPSAWGYLANFFVCAEHRGSGLGSVMLAEVVAYADRVGWVRVVLSPSEESVGLYERFGFEAGAGLMVRDAMTGRWPGR